MSMNSDRTSDTEHGADQYASGTNLKSEQWSVARYGSLVVYVVGDDNDDEQFSSDDDAKTAFDEAVAAMMRANASAGGIVTGDIHAQRAPESDILVDYRVTLKTPKGVYDVDLKSAQGPEAAARRAHWSLVGGRYGDVDEVTVTRTAVVCGWFAMCENEATSWVKHPVLGLVPTCGQHEH